MPKVTVLKNKKKIRYLSSGLGAKPNDPATGIYNYPRASVSVPGGVPLTCARRHPVAADIGGVVRLCGVQTRLAVGEELAEAAAGAEGEAAAALGGHAAACAVRSRVGRHRGAGYSGEQALLLPVLRLRQLREAYREPQQQQRQQRQQRRRRSHRPQAAGGIGGGRQTGGRRLGTAGAATPIRWPEDSRPPGGISVTPLAVRPEELSRISASVAGGSVDRRCRLSERRVGAPATACEPAPRATACPAACTRRYRR